MHAASKTAIIFAALLALTLTGCSDDDSSADNDGEAAGSTGTGGAEGTEGTEDTEEMSNADAGGGAPEEAACELGDKLIGCGTDCITGSEAVEAGNCIDTFCDVTLETLTAESNTEGACNAPGELANHCEGISYRVIAQCARDNAFEDDATSATRDCARASEQMGDVGDTCLECYVQSAACAKSNCLGPCLPGDSVECDTCREAQGCTPSFFGCAGYPDPSGNPNG